MDWQPIRSWAPLVGAVVSFGVLGCLSTESGSTGAGSNAGGGSAGAPQGLSGDASSRGGRTGGPSDADGAGVAPGDVLSSEPGGGTSCEPPTEGLGTAIGSTFDGNITLKDCGRNPVRLADLMCGHPLTLIEIGAGWCQPCIEQASTLEDRIVSAFGPEGLQVISVVFQDEQGNPATSEFCREWRQGFDLSTPVLYDPDLLSDLSLFFTDVQASTPVNLLVDANFRIVFKSAGEVPTDLGDTIASLLGGN